MAEHADVLRSARCRLVDATGRTPDMGKCGNITAFQNLTRGMSSAACARRYPDSKSKR
jgi:hypothetical protein